MSEQQWLAERFERDRAHLRAVAARVSVRRPTPTTRCWRPGCGRAAPTPPMSPTSPAGSPPSLPGSASAAWSPAGPVASDHSPSPCTIPLMAATRSATWWWPTRSARRCCWCWCLTPSRLPSDWPSCCTTCSAFPFDEIAPVVDRSPAAARQLASRARRRLHGSVTGPVDLARERAVVEAFLAASRDGDFDALLALLGPDVVLRADATTVQSAAARRAEGAPGLARESGARRGWPVCSSAAPRPRSWPSSTAASDSSGRPTASPAPCST